MGDTGEAGGTIVEEYGDGRYLEAAKVDPGPQLDYAGATSQADAYVYGGYDDWSVPTAEQMGKVVEANNDGQLAVPLRNDYYWTTTEFTNTEVMRPLDEGYRGICNVGYAPYDCTSQVVVYGPESSSTYVRFVRVGGTLIVVSTAPATPKFKNVELIDDESTVLQGALPYGTWLPVLTSVDTQTLTGRSTPDGHDLLGWSTDKNFPVDIAQRQVDNNWGAYETHNDDGRITSVFIPVGHHANITSDTQLHAIWSTPTTDAAPTAVNSQVTD